MDAEPGVWLPKIEPIESLKEHCRAGESLSADSRRVFTNTVSQISHLLTHLSVIGGSSGKTQEKLSQWLETSFQGLELIVPPLREIYTLEANSWFDRSAVITYRILSGRAWHEIVITAAEYTLTKSHPVEFLPSNHELQYGPLSGCQFLNGQQFDALEIAPYLEIESEHAGAGEPRQSTQPVVLDGFKVTVAANMLGINKGCISRLVKSGDLVDNQRDGAERRITSESVLRYSKEKGIALNDT